MNTTSVSCYLLCKFRNYDDFGIANGLHVLLCCHTEGWNCNHLSLATINTNNPFWCRKHKCLGVSRVKVSAMVTSLMVILLLCCYTHDMVT